MIYSTIDSEDQGKSIIETLLEEGMIGCGVTSKAESLYWWDGQIEHAGEFILLIKTLPDIKEAVMNRLAALHPYEVPCILSYTMESHSAYFQWMQSQITFKA